MFQEFFSHYLSILNLLLDEKYGPLVDWIRVVGFIILSIWWTIFFILLATNRQTDPMRAAWALVLGTLISPIVFSLSLYRDWIIDPILSLSFGLQGYFISGVAANPASFFKMVDDNFALLFATIDVISDQASFFSGDSIKIAILSTLLSMLFGFIYMAFSIFIIFSTFAMYVFFVLGGVFLYMAIIPATRFLFWAWLRGLASYVLIPVFVSISMGIALIGLNATITDLAALDFSTHGVFNKVVGAVFFTGIISAFFIYKSPEFAASLTSGQPSGQQGVIGGLMGGATSLGKSGVTGAGLAFKHRKEIASMVKGRIAKWRGL